VDVEVRERRAHARVAPAACGFERATLRPGFQIRVLDVSESGAQVECERALHPGRQVHVRFSGEGKEISIPALIVRCAVWAVLPDGVVIYRGGLRFEGAAVRPAGGEPS